MKRFIEKINGNKKSAYFLSYTILFLISALLVFGFFIIDGKSFIWVGKKGNLDGIAQHYVAFAYWGQYIRDAVAGFFSGDFNVPMFSSSIGFGADIIETLSYYVLGDPLNLLSALVPVQYSEYLFNALVIVRLYLAGLAFSAFAMHIKKNNRFYTLIGGLIYVFCSYTVFASVRHPYFTNPMIYFPIILLGCEYIFEGKKPWLYVMGIALAAMSNFYFFYMICILTVIYAVIRVFNYAPKGQRKKIFSYALRFIIWAVLGVLMACFLFYPSVRTTLASTRTNTSAGAPLFYEYYYYISYFLNFSNTVGSGHWCYHGTIPLTVIAVFLIWTRPKKNKTQIIFFSLTTLFLLFPIFGYLLNGMAYTANRWVWAYVFVLAIISVIQLPRLFEISKRNKYILAVILFFLFVLSALAVKEEASYYIGSACLLLTVLFVICIDLNVFKKANLMRGTVLCLAVLQVAGVGIGKYLLFGYGNDFCIAGSAYQNIKNAPSAPLEKLNDGSFYRYEDYYSHNKGKQRNAALINGGNSTDVYFSLSSDYWYEMLRSLGDKNILVQRTEGIDNRTILGTLLNVKYYTADAGKEKGTLPYGYNADPILTSQLKNQRHFRTNTKAEAGLDAYNHYINENALPLGYTYDSFITRQQYEELSYTDRQKAMLYSVVLEEKTELLEQGSPEVNKELDYTVSYDEGIKIEDGYYTTPYNKVGYIYIILNDAKAEKETYINFKNISYSGLGAVEKAKLDGSWESMTSSQKAAAGLSDIKHPDIVYPAIGMKDTVKTINLFAPTYNYYMGALDYSVNLGYYETAPKSIAVKLPANGRFAIEDITVGQIDFAGYEEQVAELSENCLEDLVISDNNIKGKISLEKDKLLCLALPYSPGWSAYVDGKKTEIVTANIGCMGILLSEGEHTVELRYFTPYLAFGIALSCVGWITFAACLVIEKKNKYRIKKYTCQRDNIT